MIALIWQPSWFVLAAGVAACFAGCQHDDSTSQWSSWTYEESDALTASQRIRAAQDLQRDSAALTGRQMFVPAEIPNNTMTEVQRRAFQQSCSHALHRQAEEHKRAARAGPDERGGSHSSVSRKDRRGQPDKW